MIWIWNEVSIVMVREDINTSGFDDRHIEFGRRSKFRGNCEDAGI